MNKQDMTLPLEALESLTRHPGWQIFKQQLDKEVETQLNFMRQAKSQEELLRFTYTYLALKNVVVAPDMMMKPLITNLEILNKQLKK